MSCNICIKDITCLTSADKRKAWGSFVKVASSKLQEGDCGDEASEGIEELDFTVSICYNQVLNKEELWDIEFSSLLLVANSGERKKLKGVSKKDDL